MRHLFTITALAALLGGCGGEQAEALWLEGAGYSWVLANHRMSHLALGVDQDGAYASVVGGTSTTNVITELDDGCEFATCQEFPFFDSADVRIAYGRVATKKAAFASGSTTLVADRQGVRGEITATLEDQPGDVVALIQGFRLDTDYELSGGTACYQPKNGWHPTQLSIVLGSATVDGDTVAVPVEVSFAAGESLESVRECVDAVNDQAQVPIEVSVLFVSAKGDSEPFTVAHGMTFPWNGDKADPEPQEGPDFTERSITAVEGGLAGFSAVEFWFHETSTEGRGAYLRSVDFEVSAEDSYASGHATNYSPGTQLSDFDYRFEGAGFTVDVGADVERGLIEEEIPVEVDEAGDAVEFRFDL